MFFSAPFNKSNLILFVVLISSALFTAKCKGVKPFESYELTYAPQANK